MRLEDRAEVLASSGHSPHKALRVSLAASVEAWTAFANDEPVCMFGVAPVDILQGIYSPWLLGSAELPRYTKHFLRANRVVIEDWKSKYPVMINYVDSRYEQAVRWLSWLGFKLEPAQPLGPQGVPFHRFTMGEENV